MKKVHDWLTLERRQAIQVTLGGLAPLAIMMGFGTNDTWEQSLIILGAVLQFVASTLSLVNLRGIIQIWMLVRGSLYALGAVVSPALVVLGFYDESTNASILTGISLALGAVSNLVAVFTAGQQKQEGLKLELQVAQAAQAGVE